MTKEARSLKGMRGRQCVVIRISVFFRISALGFRIFRRVRQLHDVIEEPGVVVAPHVEDIDLALAGVGERLEFFEALKLALIGPVVVKGSSIDDFDRPKGANGAAGQPHLAVAAHSDRVEQLVVGNRRRDAGLAGRLSNIFRAGCSVNQRGGNL